MTYTVLGASGFIGSHLVRELESQGAACWAPRRGDDLSARPLGHVLYCIGVTADFRQRTYDTVRSHVSVLLDVLERAEFESLLYLSSTRVYQWLDEAHEEASLRVNPLNPDQLYDISKLMGESVCLSCARPNVRVVRLSNVYGSDFASPNFLYSVLRDAVERGRVDLGVSLSSEKDYVNLNDVVKLLPLIAAGGRERIYNVASGANTTHREILDLLQRQTQCCVQVATGAPTIRFPRIAIDRVRKEFQFAPAQVLDSFPALIEEYRRRSAGK